MRNGEVKMNENGIFFRISRGEHRYVGCVVEEFLNEFELNLKVKI